MTTNAAGRAPRPLVLCILDGWGWREETEANAVALAETPNFDRLWAAHPHAFLSASGADVGLPDGQIGNSEVGHLNLGAGRVVMQELPRIDKAIDRDAFDDNPALTGMIDVLKQSGGTCHMLGLVSPGGVHSHQRHMVALAERMSRAGVPVAIHAFLDGRDVAPQSARDQMAAFLDAIANLDGVRVATVSGRYFAMDRDKRWDRVERAWKVIHEADGPTVTDPLAAIDASYADGKTDEFVTPVVVGEYAGVRDGDGLIGANFRADRMREILTALLDAGFDGFTRPRIARFAKATGMVTYSRDLDRLMDAIFPPNDLSDVMGEVVSRAGLTQLRIAETEKYPHVTFFFNGGEESEYPGESRIMVPSPKVATYDLQPEMSAPEVTEKVVEAIRTEQFDVIVINFANPDMVGHTGDLKAAIKAVETVDRGLGALVEATLPRGGAVLVTADHGNCEMMRDPETGGPHTAHTLNRVPLILVAPEGVDAGLRDGRLSDIAPTMLALLGVAQPDAMTGASLLQPRQDRPAE